MLGIKFRGVHSSEIGAVWKSENRPFLPTAKIHTESLPEVDGSYDFSEVNQDGRIHHEDRVFQGTISVKTKNMEELQDKLTEVARWLVGGYGELEFDDMPGTIWKAKVENPEQVMYELGKIGKATVYFRVHPYSEWVVDSTVTGIPIDFPIPLDSEYPLDFAGNIYSYAFGAETDIEVNNLGDWYTKPLVIVTGTYGYIELQIGDKSIRYFGGSVTNDIVVIDCKKFVIAKNTNDDTVNSIGDFFELKPGINEIRIISDGSGKVAFDFKFIYVNKVM